MSELGCGPEAADAGARENNDPGQAAKPACPVAYSERDCTNAAGRWSRVWISFFTLFAMGCTGPRELPSTAREDAWLQFDQLLKYCPNDSLSLMLCRARGSSAPPGADVVAARGFFGSSFLEICQKRNLNLPMTTVHCARDFTAKGTGPGDCEGVFVGRFLESPGAVISEELLARGYQALQRRGHVLLGRINEPHPGEFGEGFNEEWFVFPREDTMIFATRYELALSALEEIGRPLGDRLNVMEIPRELVSIDSSLIVVRAMSKIASNRRRAARGGDTAPLAGTVVAAVCHIGTQAPLKPAVWLNSENLYACREFLIDCGLEWGETHELAGTFWRRFEIIRKCGDDFEFGLGVSSVFGFKWTL